MAVKLTPPTEVLLTQAIYAALLPKSTEFAVVAKSLIVSAAANVIPVSVALLAKLNGSGCTTGHDIRTWPPTSIALSLTT